MDVLLRPLFGVLKVPELKLKKPAWIQQPTANQTLFFILVSYFLVTGGVIYDVIVEPPSMGSTTDEHGHSRPVAFMQYRINGQYIVEGIYYIWTFKKRINYFGTKSWGLLRVYYYIAINNYHVDLIFRVVVVIYVPCRWLRIYCVRPNSHCRNAKTK